MRLARPSWLRLTFPAGLAVGAGVVAAGWLLLGGQGTGGLQEDPGIPPPEYAYLDNPRVLSYLAQIEGGLSESEKRSQRVTVTRAGGIAGAGLQVSGSSTQDAFVEATVTPTATTRFYRLLDRLSSKGYLHDLDASRGSQRFAAGLHGVPEGDFVRIHGCRLRLPTYAQMAEVVNAWHGRITADRAYATARWGTDEEREAAHLAAVAASGAKGLVDAVPPYRYDAATARRLTAAARRYAAAVARDPRVPLSSCRGGLRNGPDRPDLLLPVALGGVTRERSVLAGPVTVVGKLVRQVRRPADVYVDRKALASYRRATSLVEPALDAVAQTEGEQGLEAELLDDATVDVGGAIILPLAIYK